MPNLDLPAVANEEQATHVPDHNKARQALIDLNTLAGQANSQADNYTLVLTDAGKMIEMTKATANTLTVPLDASVPFPVGTRIDILQVGAGQVTIVPTGLTLRSKGLYTKIAGQYAGVTLFRDGTDLYIIGEGAT